MTDVARLERGTSQLYSAPSDSYSAGSVQVRSQLKDVKPRMRERKLRSSVK